ncbi:DNA primase [Desulfatitalea tepidiphila]|uniref:DNA primase n=1 Tax=Desulfatitalea tepidiphila TaxID=1185843 RepID=UPI000B22968C|nr:DNA primase [Desulfatitalea tepidiphila]
MVRSIPDDTIQRIKNAANIVDVISEYVVLKKAGRNHLGLCPFHAEKTPSFTVSPEKQMFYCFGCHVGGNVFSFLMQKEGLSFPDAVRAVAGKYGIEVPDDQLTPAQKIQASEKEKLFRINEMAMHFFHANLTDAQKGAKAMSYLIGRGMTRKIITGYQLGYAPPRWDGLLNYFSGKNVPATLLEKAGLVIPRKDGNGYYDRFRDRVLFPIMNVNQQVLGFGGRIMTDEKPKYLNSPETPIFNKGRGLYGIQKANQAARASGRVFVVEGYFDVLAMHLYGLENSVATLGTALTPEHVQALKGMVGQEGRVYLVFDSDQAGIKAAQRSVPIFEEGFLDARVIVLPTGHDPDTFLREFGPDDFLKFADNGLGMVQFLMEAAIKRHGLTLEGKIRVINDVQEVLASVQDAVVRTLYIKQLSERLDIDETALLEKIRQAAGKLQGSGRSQTNVRPGVSMPEASRLELQIIGMMLCYPPMISEIIGRNLLDAFEDAKLKLIGQMIANQGNIEQERTSNLVSAIEDPHYRNLVAQLAMTECRWDRQGCERVLAQFESRSKRRITQDLQRKIELAEKNNDRELVETLLMEKQRQAARGLINS